MERQKLIALVTDAQNGNNKAVDALFHAYYNDVYYFALKTVKDTETACEITQDTFVSILKNFNTLKEPAAFVTWMKQIAYNHCARFFSKKRDILVEEDEEGNTVFDSVPEERAEFVPDEALDQEEFRKTILSILDQLSEEQRSATILYYYNEMSVKEIAQIQGVSEGTIKSRLNYARKAIKKSVEEYEKKNNVKLHSISLMSLMLWLFAGAEEEMPAAAVPVVVNAIAAETGAVLTSGSVATSMGAGLLSKILGLPIAVKITAGLCAALLAVTFVSISIHSAMRSEEPTLSIQAEQSHSTADTTASAVEEPTITEADATEPTNNGSPETEPSITEPSVTESVATEPTATEPPATEPPATEPPATEPSATEPPATEPPATEPPATEPPATEPPATEPPATEPPATEPQESEPTFFANYVPEGCTYIMADGTELSAGEAMPTTCSDGDRYITGAYTHVYGHEYGEGTFYDKDGSLLGVGYGFLDTDIKGWSAIVNDKSLSSYPPLPSEINGQPLVSLQSTFEMCDNMTKSPTIPSSVTNMTSTFCDCASLNTAPDIPNSVTNMTCTFYGCSSLVTAPVLPNSITKLLNTFSSCTSLTTAPTIPSGVTELSGTFSNCTSLTAAPTIPSGVTELSSTFADCTSLTTVPKLPSSITAMDSAFYNCRSLVQAPAIPSGVTAMVATFCNCTALVTAPAIPSGVTSLESTFRGCSMMTAAPEIPAGVTSMQSTFENCTSMTAAPVIPASVTNMYAAFSGCTALTGSIEIHATLAGYVQCHLADCSKCFNEGYTCSTCPNCAPYSYCFRGTKQPITIMGTCEKLTELASTAENGNSTVG